jgi:hypothetical protein
MTVSAAGCDVTADIDSWIEALKKVSAQDIVHFLAAGYDHLVNNILKTGACVVNAVASTVKATRTHFWRGFRSTVGSSAVVPSHRTPVRGRGHTGRGRNFGGKTRHHPYRRHWNKIPIIAKQCRSTLQLYVVFAILVATFTTNLAFFFFSFFFLYLI